MEVDNLLTSAHKIESRTNIEKESDHYPPIIINIWTCNRYFDKQ